MSDHSDGWLPGLVPRKVWAASLKPPRTDWTARRWQRAGRIVVRYPFGSKTPFVDVPATAARERGDDRPSRRKSRTG